MRTPKTDDQVSRQPAVSCRVRGPITSGSLYKFAFTLQYWQFLKSSPKAVSE